MRMATDLVDVFLKIRNLTLHEYRQLDTWRQSPSKLTRTMNEKLADTVFLRDYDVLWNQPYYGFIQDGLDHKSASQI